MPVRLTNLNAQGPFNSNRFDQSEKLEGVTPPADTIEPELMGAHFPRVVRLRKSTVLRLQILWNGWIALICLLGFAWRHSYEVGNAAHGIVTRGTIYHENISSRKRDEHAWNYYLFFAIVLGVLIVVPTYQTYKIWVQLRLLRYGVPVIGYLGPNESSNRKGDSYLYYGYFAGEKGYENKISASYEGYTAVVGNWRGGITVLYDPVKPKRSMPYDAATDAYLVAADYIPTT